MSSKFILPMVPRPDRMAVASSRQLRSSKKEAWLNVNALFT